VQRDLHQYTYRNYFQNDLLPILAAFLKILFVELYCRQNHNCMSREKIKDFYAKKGEKDRLELEHFKLEGIRTKEIISRYLPVKNMKIADIGGGAGYYAFWLQAQGHQVTLIDLSPANIELVNEYSKENGITLTQCQTGDATKLDLDDNQFDLVLLLGPLYHLIDKEERVKALAEAKRIVKPGGYILSAVITRYASLFDGIKRDLIVDNRFQKLLVDDLNTGVHLNETDNNEYFTSAYFHTINEIKKEVTESGLQFEKLIGVESFGWIIDSFAEKSKNDSFMKLLHQLLNKVESNDDLVAMSLHIIAVGKKVV
jgi:ubiquinone/menaquinone biosynthesis C-methylase UbiE